MFDVTCSASGTLLCLPYTVPAYVYHPHSLIARERRNKGNGMGTAFGVHNEVLRRLQHSGYWS